MYSILLALKDLKRYVGDRRAFVVNLILPLLITFIMGLSFGGGMFGSGQGISAIPVAMVGGDLPRVLQDRLAEGMTESGFFTVTWADSARADALVRQGEVAAAVVLPPDLLTTFLERDTVPIGLWKDPGSRVKADIVEQILTRAVAQYQAGEAAYLTLWPRPEESAGEGRTQLTEFLEGDFSDIWPRLRSAEGDSGWRRAQAELLQGLDRQAALMGALETGNITLSVQDKAPAGGGGSSGDINLFNYFLPGFSVFFLMFAVSGACRDIHREKKAGTLQRQMLSPVSPWQFLVGKWLGAAGQGIFMLGVLFLVGGILFRINLGPDPFSLAVTSLLCSTAAASVFLLLALVSPSEKFMDNLASVVILVSAMLGGNLIPLESMPDWMSRFGQFGFNYWANLSFQHIMVEDVGIGAQPRPVVVLAAVSGVLLVVNLGIFRLRASKGGLA